MKPPICPCCGYDIARAEPVADGRFAFDPRIGFHVDGHRIRAAPQVHELLGSIMRAGGAPLTSAVLADRLGYDKDEPVNFVAVLMTNARRSLVAEGAHFPIETIRGRGYRWNPDAPVNPLTKHKATIA